MYKKIIATIAVMSLTFIAFPVGAVPRRQIVTVNVSTPGIVKTLSLPMSADASPVISLGTAVDPQSGKVVQGFAIVHPQKGFTHKPNHPDKLNKGGANSCFAFLARGAKWKTAEPWKVNADTLSLSESFVLGNLTSNIAKWEDASNGTLDDGMGVDILGDGSLTTDVLVADTVSPDGVNEVYFADISSSGAIAVTIVWGIFYGPPFQRELVEWDQVYDNVDFEWSATGEAGKMDFENIATHELGHTIGLDHPDDSCTEETMYRFAGNGEINKRTLEAGDVAGADRLY